MTERGRDGAPAPEPDETMLPGRVSASTNEIIRPADDDTLTDGLDDRPLLGCVVLYSVATDDRSAGEPRSEHGRLYLLREGDLLFIGKPPAPRQVELGEQMRRVGFSHLFPFSREYGFVSRRHLVIEMEPGGRTLLHDFSTNGIYVTSSGEHRRRSADESSKLTTLGGPDVIVLGLDLSRQRGADAEDSASRHRLEVLPFLRDLFDPEAL